MCKNASFLHVLYMIVCTESASCELNGSIDNSVASTDKCHICYQEFKVGQLQVQFTGPRVPWNNFCNPSYHVDCKWPQRNEVKRADIMLPNKEVVQIKLELCNSALEVHELDMIHDRLDAMAENHNSYMYSIM